MSSRILVDQIDPKTSGGVITSGAMASPGGIIECLTGVCDGTSVTVASGTYTMPNVTGTHTQTTSYATLPGSEFSYTPPAGTTRVKYSFYAQTEDHGYGGISHYRFYIDSDEVVKAYKNLTHGYDANAHANYPVELSWVIVCNASTADADYGRLTSWTSAKTLKWQGRNYDSSYKMRFHMNTYEDGGAASGDETWTPPILTITAYG